MSNSYIISIISKIADFVNKSEKKVILEIGIYFIVFMYVLYISIDVFDPLINTFKKNNVVKETITYFIFNFLLGILIISGTHFMDTNINDVAMILLFFMIVQQFLRLLLKSWFKISQSNVNNKKNKVNLFLSLLLYTVPLFIIFLNQTSDFLINLKYIGPLFNIIKMKTERGKYTDIIIYFYSFKLVLSTLFITNVVLLTGNDTIKKICPNIKKVNNEYILGASCTSDLVDDIFLYSQLITIFFLVLFILYEHYNKTTQSDMFDVKNNEEGFDVTKLLPEMGDTLDTAKENFQALTQKGEIPDLNVITKGVAGLKEKMTIPKMEIPKMPKMKMPKR
jgi:hypothetical protein